MTLAEQEALFWRAARGEASAEELDQAFVGRGLRSGAGRMRIYNGAYFTRLEGALADSFPGAQAMLEGTRFTELARRYAVECPSLHFALERFGGHFPGFLARRGESRAARVAALEWARLEALLAPDDTVVGALPPDVARAANVRFCFVRSLRLCASDVSSFRAFARTQGDDATRTEGEGELHVALWRSGYRTHCRSLAALEVCALEGAGETVDLATLCQRLSAYPDAANQLSALIRSWLKQGWVRAVQLEPAEQAMKGPP
jgi:hypothetical protein